MASWEWSVVTILAGLAGVLFGAFITLRLERLRENRLNAGAARVTFWELAENKGHLEGAIARAETAPLVTETWPETRARLAAMLSPGDLGVVAGAYMGLTTTKLVWAQSPLGSPMGAVGVPPTQAALDRVIPARDILERRGWPSDRERAELHKEFPGL